MSIDKAYNVWAKQYDTNKNRTRDLDQKSTIETLSRFPFSNVLELGCGTGKNTAWLIKKADSIVGFDFSEEMLKVAKSKVQSDHVRFQQADLNNDWEIDNNAVDLITSSLTLEHIKNLDHIFHQASKKLIDNGYFFISELHPFKQYVGTKARYETEEGIQELEVYIHHISEFITNAESYGFKMVELKEWFDGETENEIPRLVSFVFIKTPTS
ncbi:class I SAM-dependent DNA methyltransferase [Flammeovirga agarivorans]|uniref:Class I SAM-dependent methyltransferase n=1 Tax=Flammeovirga agarivorans TaxID=2726742 RepID=A0A7X8SL12_9BACT|nr:class I SAM-dependent methyltransferase [Flammeovirga agarivorans]NLR92077.1 class I SAM-dependent methyltransferase [Flammeovirga agarivorans]